MATLKYLVGQRCGALRTNGLITDVTVIGATESVLGSGHNVYTVAHDNGGNEIIRESMLVESAATSAPHVHRAFSNEVRNPSFHTGDTTIRVTRLRDGTSFAYEIDNEYVPNALVSWGPEYTATVEEI